jgi:serine/threonine-protein kinase
MLREAQAAARLCHPGVVRVLDLALDGPSPCLVMERLEGQDLRSRLDTAPVLTTAETLSILLRLSGALAQAHARGVIHRDVKPENVFLVVDEGGTMQPKLLDFGVSKLVDEMALTHDATMLGTPLYMAPELLEGAGRASALSDQYAMGVMAFEMVTGRAPFAADTPYALLSAIALGEHARPSDVVPSLDPSLEAVILRMMAFQPSARFARMEDVMWALSSLVVAHHGHGCPTADAQGLARADTQLVRVAPRRSLQRGPGQPEAVRV